MTTSTPTIQKEFILLVNHDNRINLPGPVLKHLGIKPGESQILLTVTGDNAATIQRAT